MENICQVKKPVFRNEWNMPYILSTKTWREGCENCSKALLNFLWLYLLRLLPQVSLLKRMLKDHISVQPSLQLHAFEVYANSATPKLRPYTEFFILMEMLKGFSAFTIWVLLLGSVTTSFTVTTCPSFYIYS